MPCNRNLSELFEVHTRGAKNWWQNHDGSHRRQVAIGFGYAAGICFLFIKPLCSLVTYALGSDLHSHILLVPFISAYLLSCRRRELPDKYVPSPTAAMISLAVGVAALMAGMRLRGANILSGNDYLALTTFAFLCLQIAGGFQSFGKSWMTAAMFPVAFLFFLVPLPDALVNWLETASKLASAEVANLFFNVSGTPVVRDGVTFQLPGIVIQVAQECSGIRSSWVLFITSLVASQVFLNGTLRRFIFVALVIPLGVLRNGFRILVIGLLCTHIGPHMIHHAIHKRGGPLFFLLSLIPFFFLLGWLRRGEIAKKSACKQKADSCRIVLHGSLPRDARE